MSFYHKKWLRYGFLKFWGYPRGPKFETPVKPKIWVREQKSSGFLNNSPRRTFTPKKSKFYFLRVFSFTDLWWNHPSTHLGQMRVRKRRLPRCRRGWMSRCVWRGIGREFSRLPWLQLSSFLTFALVLTREYWTEARLKFKPHYCKTKCKEIMQRQAEKCNRRQKKNRVYKS